MDLNIGRLVKEHTKPKDFRTSGLGKQICREDYVADIPMPHYFSMLETIAEKSYRCF